MLSDFIKAMHIVTSKSKMRPISIFFTPTA